MLNRTEKDAVIAGIKNDIDSSKAVFLTNLIGISSNDSVALRKEIREKKGKIVVTRNTLFKKASEGTGVCGEVRSYQIMSK